MPYEVKFADAIEQALSSDDVAGAIAQSSQIDLDYVRNRLRQDESEVLGLITPSLQTYADIEKSISEIRAEHRQLMAPPTSGIAFYILFAYTVAGSLAWILGWLLGADYPATFLRNAWYADWSWQRWVLTALAIILFVTALMALRWRIRRARNAAQIEADPRLPSRQRELAAQGEEIDRQVNDLVLANAFEAVGRFGSPFFQGRLVQEGDLAAGAAKRLRVSSPRGLSEVADRAHEAPTAARREILDLLNKLPGASIGLSGPRGSGKSTILRSLTAANLPLRDRDAIAIYTAAPVEYEARDFLLHLFATLCRQVLRTYGRSESDRPDARPALETGDPDWADRLQQLAPPLRWLGYSLTVLALAIAAAVQNWSADSGPGALLKAMDLKPGGLLLFGLSALVTGLALQIHTASKRGPFHRRLLRAFFSPWSSLARLQALSEPEPELVRATRRELLDIRFQRSFTSGWSGAIKIPVGFDISETRSIALAQRQESLPELVDRFCAYVRVVAAAHGAVVIAVDELDKLKGAQEAEQFINSVKSIFAIPNCFYLVSVSEDALSAFERRGLSLRDAFDSAFDDIRYIGYKDLEESRQMLLRRVLNLPDPFLCLCHVLSGGLPRDLIRIARAMFRSASQLGPDASVMAIARALVQQEATAKIRASRTAMRSISLEPEVGDFAAALAALEERPVGRSGYRQRLDSLVAVPREDADPLVLAKLTSIQRELRAYLAFLAVTLELSKLLATRQGWRASADRLVDRLARARQALESSVSVGILQVDTVGEAVGKARVARAT